MALTIRTTSDDDMRTQIHANLKVCGIPNLSRLDIFTSKVEGGRRAWVVDTDGNKCKAIIKGPLCSTCEEALGGLLDATSELVSKKLGGVFEEFDEQLSAPVGNAFVLEPILEDAPTAK